MKKILLTSLFILGLVLAGSSVNAMGGEVHLVGEDGVATTDQLTYTQTLRRGVKNANVLALQKKLKEMGYYHKALDSDYGSGTQAAVRMYQVSKGLTPDGIAGPLTFAKILGTSAASLTATKTSLTTKPVESLVVCTKEYAPVCGTDMNSKYATTKTYGNKCLAEKAGAKILYKGKCKSDITLPATQEKCLKVTPNSSNSPVVAQLPVKSYQVAEFELENVCDEELELEDIDFEVISSYTIPQFDDIIIRIDGDVKDTIDDVIVHNAFVGGKKLEIHADVQGTELKPGEEVDLTVHGDVWGVYRPWIGSSTQSTAFAVSFNDADGEYEGQHYGWNQRPVWDNLIVVHYAE